MAFYFGSYLLDLLGLLTAIVAVGYVYIWWTFQHWKRKNIPYLEPTIPWGNFENVFVKKLSLRDEILGFYKEAKPKGWKYFGIYAITELNLVLLDLDLVKQVMMKDYQNFVDKGFYANDRDDPLSAHLFAIGGTKWKNLRIKLTPTFTSVKMKSMFNILVECGLALEKYIERNIDNDRGLNVKEVLGKFSTDIIGSYAFGLECNSFNDPNSPFRIYGRKIFEPTRLENVKFFFANTFPNLARKLRVTITPKGVSEFMIKVVEDTINYRRKNKYTRNDFLQLLIDIMDNDLAKKEGFKGDGRTLTMDEAASQCFGFFIAGFETSSTTMTYALYELARHQYIQDRVREEINTVLSKHDGKITYDSMNDLKYMKQVIEEALRIYTPAPMLTRVAAEDYKVPGVDLVIEQGTKVIIPIQGIHLDEEYYENPLEFNPERFSEENKAGRHPCAHIPFGEGPRICIGKRFGIMQAKVGLTSLLRNFRVTLNKNTKTPFKMIPESFIPSVEGGIWLNLEKV